MKKCVLCGETSGLPVWREQEAVIVRCGGCGLIYTDLEQDIAETFWKKPRPEKLDQVDFYWDTARARVYDEVLELLETLKDPEEKDPPRILPRILDVGCGKGFFLKRASERGWDAYGQELSPHAVSFARERLGLTHVDLGRIENVSFPPDMFRVITLWDVIEHLPDPGPILAKSAQLLGERGVLFIQTPNIEFHLPYARAKRLLARGPIFKRSRKHLLEAKHHLVQFSRATLTRMLTKAGFRNISYHVLLPIESVAGSRNAGLAALKSGYTRLARGVFDVTNTRVLLSNTLHVFATRGELPLRTHFKALRR